MKYSYADVLKGRKAEVNPWYRIFEEPLGTPMLYVLVNFLPFLSPNILTLIGFLLTLVAAWAFFAGYLIWGAVLFEAGRFFDWFDGKVAKVTKNYSNRGMVYDEMADHARTFLMAGSLGFYATLLTDDLTYIALAFVYASLVALTYIMASLVSKTKGAQLMTAMAAEQPNSIVVKIKQSLAKWRLRLGYTQHETDTVAFFFAPIIAGIWGVQTLFYSLSVAIVMISFLLLVFWVLFLKTVKEDVKKA